ncbi:MAG TPA: hypothetical protein VE439_01785 [Anaerolineae bacterium]|nr:hypothetical protein [Anaerolineae bacterium]
MFYWLKKREAERLAAQIEQGVSDPSEMISTAMRVRNAFRKDTKFDRDVQDRVLKRITAASGRPESRISTVAQNRPTKSGKVLVAVGLVAALAILILVSSKTYLPLKGFNTEKALAAIERPGMITYYKVIGSYKGNDPAYSPNWQAEYWVDHEKQMLKSINRSYDKIGGFNTTSYYLIRDGKAINMSMINDEVNGVNESEAQEFSGDDPIMGGVREYRKLLKSGEAEVLGEEEVKGIATYKIMVKSTAKDGTTEIEVANIRKDNYKPLKVIHEVWKTQQGKKSELNAVWTIFIDEIKLINPKDLDKDVFTIDIPKGIDYQITRNLSIEQARQFKEFDLYYLGKSFNGLKFGGHIQYLKQIGRELPKGKGLSDRIAYIEYYDSKKPGGVSISISPIMEPDIEKSQLIPYVKRTSITINGNPAVLTVQESLDSSICTLFINIGRSTVNITSGDKDEAEAKDRTIKATESLVKIN